MRNHLLKKSTRQKFLSRAFCALIFIFLYAPIAVVILFSFNVSRRNILFEGFTFSWYKEMFSNGPLLESFANTLIVAASSTSLAVVIGVLAAVAMFRYKFKGKGFIDAMLYVPVVIPEIVLGISLLASFAIASIPLGRITLIIAHTTFSIPFVVFTVRARLAGYDKSVEEAAMDLGANRLQVLTGITIPIILPGIIAGAVLAFTLSIDDFIISFFTTGSKSITFPLKIMESVRSGIRPDAYALSSIIMLVTFIVVVVSQLIAYRTSKKEKL
ncbi:MAG: ABC transporter permease subunit [Elusimicrobiota bacterium]|jgi:spermidine/putrescine transport system permease protein|nr:ABC transporter permease subunit [Elusimicrobiota bacterium]